MPQSSEITAIWPEGTPKPLMPYSPAVRAGDWLFVAGHLASDYENGLPPEITEANPNLVNRMGAESAYLLDNIAKTIAAAGGDFNRDSVRIFQWMVSDKPTLEEFDAGETWPDLSITPYLDARNKHITDPRPASTALSVHELLVKDTTVEVDVICRLDGAESVGIPVPAGLPSPLAGYSPALVRGDYVFLAGEIPVDWVGDYGQTEHRGPLSALAPEARVNPYLWYGSEIEQQTDYVLGKLDKIAKAAGTTLDRTIKADVYIAHPSDFAGMDKVWSKYFPENPPARMVMPYMGFGGKSSRIEIALQLLTGESELTIETVHTDLAPTPIGQEPQAVKCGDLLYFSTQMAFADDGNLADGMARRPEFPYYGAPARDQVRYILKNVAAIAEAGGTDLENIVRRLCFHDDFAFFQEAIDEWAAHFPGVKPASSTIGLVPGQMVVPGAKVLLDLIAYVPQS
ncbi:RidA family protein [Microbacterium sp. CPCC 204701]|uniref:RidA family protein n=1 Tax=Microbacterium sp. CPCC 204701 TaxID=2493084 RepID=UPI000FDAA119|nr:RidA family protein [Microbacterium sp. CPCC 204701]